MMTISAMVKVSERMRRLNSRLVKIVGYKTGSDKKGIPTAVCKTYTPLEYRLGARGIMRSRDLNKYTSSIKFLDKRLNIRCSCSCPDYMFRWEYANNLVGASDIIYGNGDPPDETNPRYRPGFCKHLLALRTLIKAKHGV